MENTIDDLDNLEIEAKEKTYISGKDAFPNVSRAASQNTSIFDYCRDLCKSFLYRIEQVEATLHNPANHSRSRKGPAGEAWKPQILVTPELCAINHGRGYQDQVQLAAITTDEKAIMQEWSNLMAQRRSK